MNPSLHPDKQRKLQIINWLVDHFPSAFSKKTSQIKPLKLGVFEDIMDFYERLDSPPYSKKHIREALQYYSASPAYLLCQTQEAKRIDLYGQEVDVVTEEQAQYAAARYQQRYALRQANK